MPARALTDRDIETLESLDYASSSFIEMKHQNGFVASLDCGGSNGSHHSATLRKLSERGLAERHKFGRRRDKGVCWYRITEAGRTTLTAQGRRVKTVSIPVGGPS